MHEHGRVYVGRLRRAPVGGQHVARVERVADQFHLAEAHVRARDAAEVQRLAAVHAHGLQRGAGAPRAVGLRHRQRRAGVGVHHAHAQPVHARLGRIGYAQHVRVAYVQRQRQFDRRNVAGVRVHVLGYGFQRERVVEVDEGCVIFLDEAQWLPVKRQRQRLARAHLCRGQVVAKQLQFAAKVVGARVLHAGDRRQRGRAHEAKMGRDEVEGDQYQRCRHRK